MAPRLMYLDLASPTEAQRQLRTHSSTEKILHRENYSTTLPAHFHLFPRRFAQQPNCRAALTEFVIISVVQCAGNLTVQCLSWLPAGGVMQPCEWLP